MYTEQEIITIQNAIASGKKVDNPDIVEKMRNDERVETYGYFGFFPETFDLVYGSETSPAVKFEGGNRGIIGILKHGDKNVVIKPVQSRREPGIAKKADDMEVGPKQYKTLDGFITEQYVDLPLFTKLDGSASTKDKMYLNGMKFGRIMTKLHGSDIYYNDTTLADDLGRSHYFVSDDSDGLLFDYGVAIDLENHPNYTDEEVFDYARTIPGMELFFLGAENDSGKIKAAILNYRPEMGSRTKERILERDLYFVNSGISFAEYRLGRGIAEPFMKGFNETYQR